MPADRPAEGTRVLNIGIDIGGTKIAGGVVSADGSILDRIRVDTPTDTDDLAAAVGDMVRHFRETHDVTAVGVAAAGFLDRTRSVMRHAPNIDWVEHPLRSELEARAGIAVTLENDANAAGWAEYRFGAGRGTSDMIMLTLGTGVGGAVIIDGQLLIGGRGAAGELGHVRFERDGRPCGCGLRGCLEQYASGRALQREAADLADDPELGTGLAGVRDASGVIHGDAISRLILGGDPGALEALRRVATALGETAGGFQAAFDPEIFVIGGGVAQLGETLLAPVRERYRASLPGGANAAGADFAIATLGNDAGLIGVADLAGGR